jgi:hypothetical protein
MCSVVDWFVINELKGMWKEAVVKLNFSSTTPYEVISKHSLSYLQ